MNSFLQRRRRQQRTDLLRHDNRVLPENPKRSTGIADSVIVKADLLPDSGK